MLISHSGSERTPAGCAIIYESGLHLEIIREAKELDDAAAFETSGQIIADRHHAVTLL